MFDTIPTLDCAGRPLRLDRPRIMGIVNVTPDSFSDGGHHATPDAAVAHALQLVAEGADVLDVGGETTRPGARPVSEQEELDRVLPVIERLARETDRPISVDTYRPAVMRAAVAAGAGMVNDVWGLRQDGALEAVASLGVPVVLMHMQGTPETMQQAPQYDDVLADVRNFLAQRVFACEMSGIPKSRIVLDPGFGFGKTLAHNLALLRNLDALASLGCPVLAGLSRKSMLGAITGQPVEGRLAASITAAVLAAQGGALLLRVHDVAATRDALALLQAVRDTPRVASGGARTAAPRWGDDD